MSEGLWFDALGMREAEYDGGDDGPSREDDDELPGRGADDELPAAGLEPEERYSYAGVGAALGSSFATRKTGPLLAKTLVLRVRVEWELPKDGENEQRREEREEC